MSDLMQLLHRLVLEFSPMGEGERGVCCYCLNKVDFCTSKGHDEDCAWLNAKEALEMLKIVEQQRASVEANT